MQTLIRLLQKEQSDLGLHFFLQTYLSNYLDILGIDHVSGLVIGNLTFLGDA